LKLWLREIVPEGCQVSRQLTQAWLEDVLSGSGSVSFRPGGECEITIQARRVGVDVLLQSDFGLDLTADCSNCLNDFALRVTVGFSVTLRPAPAASRAVAQDLELTEDDLGEFFFEGDFIDLGEILREQILLALPMYPRCSEDCRGLCPVCGANLNQRECGCERGEVDPRLIVLKSISKN
jgi:uncharacterized protein